MARRVRIEYAGAYYHVMNRGNARGAIFVDDADRMRFVSTLGRVCDRTGWRVHAYVLMGNHYHWLLETPEPNLVSGMKWFQGTYTQRLNRRHNRCGHLFQGRYKAIPIEPAELGILHRCSSYIHLNPLRAGLADFDSSPLNRYTWSSYPFYASGRLSCPEWLERNRIYGSREIDPKDPHRFSKYARGVRRIAERSVAEAPAIRQSLDGEWQCFREGWYVGSDSFREKIMSRIQAARQGCRPESHVGGAVRSHNEGAADKLLQIGLNALDLAARDLVSLPGNDPRKVVLAWLLKTRTVVTNRWVSSQLQMGVDLNVSRALARVESGLDDDARRWAARRKQAADGHNQVKC